MADRSVAVIILGMHRSGTSLLTQTVRSLGVYMGDPNQMVPPREDNPEGFWEHAEMVAVHDKLLGRLSSSWDATRPLPEKWWLTEPARAYRAKLGEIVARDFAGRRLWGFKDPRTCLLLPLWQSLLEELGIEARYIVSLRNPLNVAASLHKRDRFLPDKSFAIWNLYVLSSLYYTGQARRIVIDYDRLLERPAETGRQIGDFLNVPYGAEEQARIEKLAKPSLRHSRRSMQEVWADDSIPAMVRQTYQWALSGGETPSAPQEDDWNRHIRNAYDQLLQADRLFNHERSYRIQLYWSGADGPFAEDRSTYLTVGATGRNSAYEVEIRESLGAVLRIDFLEVPAFVKLSKLSLVHEGQEADLLRDCDREYIQFLALAPPDDRTEGISGLSLGPASHLLIRDLPPHGEAPILRLELSCLEQRLDMLELLYEDGRRREAELAAATRELHEERAAASRLIAEIESREREAKERQALLVRQKELEIEAYRREAALYANSWSWKITLPLRVAKEIGRAAKRRLKKGAKALLQRYMIRTRRRSRDAGLAGKLPYKRYALIFSHTNYRESMGGTEKYIFEQASHLARTGTGIIQIYPGQSGSLLGAKEDAYYGIVVGDQFRGFYSVRETGEWLSRIRGHLVEMHTHHLLNWQIGDYAALTAIAEEGGSLPHTFFMHDFFALCSSYHMIYQPKMAHSIKEAKERRPCVADVVAASGAEADICRSCMYGAALADWRAALLPVLRRADRIVAPSDFVKETAAAVYPDIADRMLVRGHLIFDKQTIVRKPKPERRKLRIAFLGYRMDNKGWAAWERLYKDEALGRLYDFHHVGAQEKYAEQVAPHRYSFLQDGRMGATRLLIKQDIDLVLLWSIVPESYSYTLQEAIAAGVPVLTSPLSGNIAVTVDAHPELGKVLSGEEELRAFLLDTERVRSYVSGDRARYVLEYNHLPAIEREARL